jgi:hypothetical protein
MVMNVPLSPEVNGMHALGPSQVGGSVGIGVGVADVRALESQVVLLMRKWQDTRGKLKS